MPGITPRHCSRLLKRYRQLGPLGMSNHSRGRAGNRLLPTSLIDQALRIIREHYRDFDPTLARFSTTARYWLSSLNFCSILMEIPGLSTK
ncbi:hypothetical protein ACF5F0_000217 [Salmonella enterica]